MLSIADEGKLQMTAGLALLETSKLVGWDWETARFAEVTIDDFECALKNFDATFGRVICWIIFSAGAEFLAKGVCLLRGVENIRTPGCVLEYPPSGSDMITWAKKVQKKGFLRTEPTTKFGQIGTLRQQHLPSLCKKVNAEPGEKSRLLAAYELLGTSIRNRDAHAYVPKQRESHFYLVRELFVPCLNDLVSWTQLSARELNKWRKDAQQFIDDLAQSDQNLATSICNEVATRKKKLRLIPRRLQNLPEDDLDRVILFLDQLEASMDDEDLALAEQGMTDYAKALADEDAR